MKTENNINKKKLKVLMKNKIFAFMLAIGFILTFGTAFATNNEIMSLDFEEGGGFFVFDHGTYHVMSSYILPWNSNDLTWNSTSKVWGQYSASFDGNGDYIYKPTNYNYTFPNEKTFSFWIQHRDNDTQPDNIFHGWNDDGERIIIKYNENLNRLEVFETDASKILRTYYYDGVDLSGGNWKNLIIKQTDIDRSLFIDGVFHSGKVLFNPANEITYNNMVIGEARNISTGDDLNANLDSFKIFDFALSSNQITELYTTNYVFITQNFSQPISEDEIDSIQKINFIEGFSPKDNVSYVNPVKVSVQLNQSATCEFYHNGVLNNKEEEILSYNQDFNFDLGDNFIYTYCYFYAENGGEIIKYYDLTDIRYFNVTLGTPANIGITITGKDFNVADQNLYIVSPCLNEGITHLVSDKAYSSTFNEEGVFIKKLNTGYAEFNFSQGNYELCVFHGILQNFKENNKTIDYNVNKFYNQIDIGTLTIDDNESQYYTISLENFDLYTKSDPKAWGTSWVALSSGIIGLIFGLLIIFIGVQANIPKMTLIGAILIILSLGFSVSGIFAILI